MNELDDLKELALILMRAEIVITPEPKEKREIPTEPEKENNPAKELTK